MIDYSDEQVSILVDLGLSLSQAKVYLVLAKTKKLTAYSIHSMSGVARPDVYRVLCELEQIGLVKKIISKPQNYLAVTADECVSTLLHRRNEKTAQLKKDAKKLAEAMGEDAIIHENDEKFRFMIITGRNAVYTRFEKMFESVQENVCFLGLTRRALALFEHCLPSFEEALTREVDIRVIIPKPQRGLWEPLKSLNKYPNCTVRLNPEQPKTSFSVWDQKEILMTTSAIDTPTPPPILWSNNKSMVDLCREYFECLWLGAEKVDIPL